MKRFIITWIASGNCKSGIFRGRDESEAIVKFDHMMCTMNRSHDGGAEFVSIVEA